MRPVTCSTAKCWRLFVAFREVDVLLLDSDRSWILDWGMQDDAWSWASDGIHMIPNEPELQNRTTEGMLLKPAQSWLRWGCGRAAMLPTMGTDEN